MRKYIGIALVLILMGYSTSRAVHSLWGLGISMPLGFLIGRAAAEDVAEYEERKRLRFVQKNKRRITK